jgi:hypothetical protein
MTFLLAPLTLACDQHPRTRVVLENKYPSSGETPFIVYRAFWQAVPFQQPLPPGSSSDEQDTVPASLNAAYAAVAPGWDPDASTVPTSFLFLQSKSGFEVHLNDTLDIGVDDATFAGNCAAGSFISQEQADFMTQRIFTQTLFPDAFAPFFYDATSCATTAIADAGGP